MGEHGKIVPVSPQRFVALGVNNTSSSGSCLRLVLRGMIPERVRSGALSPLGISMETVVSLSNFANNNVSIFSN